MNHIGTERIETERLILRMFREGDAEAQFNNWSGDPEVTRYLRWEAHKTIEESREAIARRLKRYEEPDTYMWAIEQKAGALMGAISAHIDSEADSIAGVGYCLGRAFWGKGYMTEALKAVIEFMFLRVGVNRIEAVHAVSNPASGAVMRKAGMLREGRLRQAYRNREGFHDGEIYGIVREDWDIRREMDFYNALPVEFKDFIGPGELTDGEISLVCAKKSPAIPEKKWVPAYEFDIIKGGEKVGHVGLRVGYTDGLYYGGQIGYGVDEAHRGRGYAGRACALLAPVLRAHGMKFALITNDVNNASSRRVCEKLGARHVRAATLPEWHDLYKEGERAVNIYEWAVGDAR
jgi:ribosomal-protein-alanine N-acetyltransferase